MTLIWLCLVNPATSRYRGLCYHRCQGHFERFSARGTLCAEEW